MRVAMLTVGGLLVLMWSACGGSTVDFRGPGAGGSGAGGEGGTAETVTDTVASSTTGETCGDGVCSPGEASSCPEDCAPACAHSECEIGDPLTAGCSSCVSDVCAEDPYCCEQAWDSQCIEQADAYCGLGCCGNGKCEGETCESCSEDCGVCPTCPHSVCETGAALDTMLCRADCVTEVCKQDPSCCGTNQESGWSVPCQKLAVQLCQADPCVAAVCGELPACCTTGFNAACVAKAQELCKTPCDCSHGICEPGDPLVAGCEPCTAAVCAADPYCCDSAWDGICVNEVASICGVVCGGP